jgi:Fe-S cluster assembly protein SufD
MESSRTSFRTAPRTHPKEVHLHTFNVEGSAALAGPPWLRDRRAAGLSAVESSVLPSESEEVWRYTPIDDLDLGDFVPVTSGPGELSEAGRIVTEMVGDSLGQLSAQVVVHNGFPLSFGSQGGGGARVGGAADVPGAQSMLGSVQVGGDALVRLNDAFAPDAVLVDVPAGVVVPDPILIVHWCDAGEDGSPGTAVFPRTAVRLGDGASAAVVEVVVGPIGSVRSLVVPVTELSAGDEASLSYVSLQILNHAAWSLARLAARGGRDSVLRTFTVGLGGDYDRVRADVSVDGRGARSEILSAYLGSGTQVHDIRTLQDHLAPRTNSELLCQGAVAGTSRSVYSGLIRVHRGAVRSDARQTNHNLVLDEGPIDEDQRYYIESRGVTPDVAEGLIVRGFFDAIIDRGPIPAVTPLLKREVHARLDVALGERRVIGEAADV